MSFEKSPKTWKIGKDYVARTTGITNQFYIAKENPALSQRCSTNGIVMWHETTYSHFCVGTIFTMKSKSLKGTRANDCYQFFVIEKGHFYFLSRPKKSDAQIAMKLFINDIGTPEPVVVDVAIEKNLDM